VEEAAPNEYAAALRVFSASLSRAELESRFGESTRGHDVGEPVSRRRPDGLKRTEASWILETALARTEKLDRHLEELVAFAETRREVIDAVRATGGRVDIYCGIFDGRSGGTKGGFTIQPSLSRSLGELDLPVAIEIY
jgi:hypothetical protein